MSEQIKTEANPNASVPGGRLMEHEYDGIREYDNPTPGWWHMLLWGCIAFSVVYVLWAHFSVFAPNERTRWAAAQTAYFEKLFGAYGQMESDEATIVEMTSKDDLMKVAESIFNNKCVSCHGAGGAGGTGPNLTDDHWIHANEDIVSVYAVITDGVVAKGMPAWEKQLNKNQRVILAAYVAAMRNEPLPGKAAEGEIVPAWPRYTPDADSAPADGGAGEDDTAALD